MKTRIISFSEVENRVRNLVAEFHRRPLGEKLVLKKGAALPVILRLCISQMKAGDSARSLLHIKQIPVQLKKSEFK